MTYYKNNLSYERYLNDEKLKDDNSLLEMAVRILHNEKVNKYNIYWLPRIQAFLWGCIVMCVIIGAIELFL